MPKPVITTRFDAAHPAAVAWAKQHAAELVTDISKTTRTRIRSAVVSAFKDGTPPHELADKLERIVGDDERAELIANTESMTAANEGQRQLWKQAVEKDLLDDSVRREWITTGDEILCDECESLDGKTAPLDGEYPEPGSDGPPLHPRCLPGDCYVAAGGFIAAQSERSYQGNLIVIRTAAGKQLRCTPNHPILTGHGWIAAGEIHKGDQVVSSVQRELVLAVDTHDIYVPTRIKEIADAFRVSCSVKSRTVMTTTPDFHGDGIDGQVAVIRTNSFLRRAFQSQRQQRSLNAFFQFRLIWKLLVSYRSFDHSFNRLRNATYSVVSGFNQCVNFLLRHSCEASSVTFANGGSALMGSSDLRLPLFRSHLRPMKSLVFTGGSQLNPGRNQFSFNGKSIAEPTPTTDAIQALACQVSLDNVISIEREYFSGQVYNLQMEHGWYLANGIITQNCRCTEGIVYG